MKRLLIILGVLACLMLPPAAHADDILIIALEKDWPAVAARVNTWVLTDNYSQVLGDGVIRVKSGVTYMVGSIDADRVIDKKTDDEILVKSGGAYLTMEKYEPPSVGVK